MGPDQGDRGPARAKAESKAEEGRDDAVVTVQARAAPVFVQAAEKKRRISWELPVLI